jgi:hypothetical protein
MPMRARAALLLLESSKDRGAVVARVDGCEGAPSGQIRRLGGLGRLGYKVELGRHLAKLGERTNFHLPHSVAAVDFHSSFADTYFAGNLLAKSPPRDLNHNLSLPRT